MTNNQSLALHQSLALFDKLGLIEWLSKDVEESTRVILNALAQYLLDEEVAPLDFRPFCPSDRIYNYFIEHSWDIDWFDLLSGSLLECVEREINTIAIHINDQDPLTSVPDAEELVTSFVAEWQEETIDALKQAIHSP